MSGELDTFTRLGESYGRAAAVLVAAGEAFNQAVAESYARTRRALEEPVDPEAVAAHRYRRRIEAERELGLAFVRAEARRVRAELGIRP